jgi:hypothetical protein
LWEGTPPNKVKQGKSRESRKTKRINGKSSSPSETVNPRTPNEIRGISGIRIAFKQWDSPIRIWVL